MLFAPFGMSEAICKTLGSRSVVEGGVGCSVFIWSGLWFLFVVGRTDVMVIGRCLPIWTPDVYADKLSQIHILKGPCIRATQLAFHVAV